MTDLFGDEGAERCAHCGEPLEEYSACGCTLAGRIVRRRTGDGYRSRGMGEMSRERWGRKKSGA